MDTHSHPEIIQMQVQLMELSKKVERHDTLLVTGSDDALSLPEIVRNLSLTVENYIKRKDKEEALRTLFWDKFRWVIISTAVPALFVFFGQAFIFFFKVVPIILSLSK